MILVCGILADAIIECVCARLVDMQLDYLLLDELDFPGKFDVCWEARHRDVVGYVSSPDRTLDLRDVTGIYIRYVDYKGSSSSAPGIESRLSLEEQTIARCEYQATLLELSELMPCTVINRASASISNDSKVFQGFLAAQFGFLTPKTIVTTDPKMVREFYEECERKVIYKSLSSVRSVIKCIDANDLKRLDQLRNCPVQFQKMVAGTDVRVHVVGEELFATQIKSDAQDYRYARREGREACLSAVELPAGVATACVEFTRSLGLEFSGIDLRRLEDGQYCCFEVNPSPGFLFYERSTGQPISKAVAELLAKSRKSVAS